MIKDLPGQINLVFILTTIVCCILFLKAARYNPILVLLIAGILLFECVLGLTGFYTDPDSGKYRLPFLILPSLLMIGIVFMTKSGRRFTERLSLKSLTWIHVVRIPVEFVLHWLFLNRMVPDVMTFEGANYDILSGLYTPVIIMFGFRKRFGRRRWLIIWNCLCLALLLNVIILSILAGPATFAHFGFSQPNKAVLFFPFVWLPSCIVPIVLYAHLAALFKLVRYRGDFVS
ncbi:hypothetical protein [Pollutibacter soli]|uniref:hypothetical protein n=1 Tax=Pollutibacter soli TaxID=3034157 RepID=UPI003013B8D9